MTEFPASTMDIFPTIAEILELPKSVMLQPQDGISLKELLTKELGQRNKPIPFSCFGNTALLDNNYKLLQVGKQRDRGPKNFELYNLAEDPRETTNLMTKKPAVAKRMQAAMQAWKKSMGASLAGKDYPAGKVLAGDPEPRFWMTVKQYEPYFEAWRKRPEYRTRLKNVGTLKKATR